MIDKAECDKWSFQVVCKAVVCLSKLPVDFLDKQVVDVVAQLPREGFEEAMLATWGKCRC